MSLFHNLVHIFGGGSMNQIVDSQQASQLIKNVDDTVHESWKMLLALKALLPAPELQAIEFEHNQLYLMVVEVKSDVRGRQGRQVFFANATERDEFYVQVQQLLERCKIHHNDLMSVSRRAYQRALEAQAAGPSSASPTPVSTNQVMD
ncbi:hypothetical protein FRC11_013602 [Ceratobasidium sp. 423]|nr:hypothetical protein FRC11_013602 [Ceratobasidium sp. 423]